MGRQKFWRRCRPCRELRDRATDQQDQSHHAGALGSNPRQPSPTASTRQLIDDTLYDASVQRQVTQYFTQLNSYHVILEVLPEMQASLDRRQDLYENRRLP